MVIKNAGEVVRLFVSGRRGEGSHLDKTHSTKYREASPGVQGERQRARDMGWGIIAGKDRPNALEQSLTTVPNGSQVHG